MNSPGANDSMMNRPHLPVRERLAGENAASIADSFVSLRALNSSRSWSLHERLHAHKKHELRWLIEEEILILNFDRINFSKIVYILYLRRLNNTNIRIQINQ